MESALVASAGVSAVAAGEYLLRQYLPRSPLHYPWIPNSRVSFTLDPEQYPGFDLAGEFRINSIGERGSTLASGGSRRPLRILVMGGSAAECLAISDNYYWPLVLQREMDRLGVALEAGYSSIHVGSIGRSLAPVQIQKRALDLISPRYREIDLVITYFGASDILHWMEQGCNRMQYEKSMQLTPFFRANCFPPYRLNAGHSAIGKLTKQIMRKLISQPLPLITMGSNFRKLRLRRQKATEILDEVPRIEEFYACFRRSFVEFVEALTGICKRIIVVEQPWICRALDPDEEKMMWHFSFGDPRTSERGAYFSHDYTDGVMRRISAIQREVASERGLAFIGLIDKLTADLEHYADYFHQTPKGNVEIGRTLAAEISPLLSVAR